MADKFLKDAKIRRMRAQISTPAASDSQVTETPESERRIRTSSGVVGFKTNQRGIVNNMHVF